MKTIKNAGRDTLKQRILRRLRIGTHAGGGFTLIELLVVIIIIAVLATIAIPTFMGQRQHAQDAAAYSLVRNALTAIQGAFVDTNDYTLIAADDLHAIEPSIDFIRSDADLVSTTPAWISDTLTAAAAANQVEYYPQAGDIVDLACKSDSGNMFGIQVNALNVSESGYVKVKVIEGTAGLGW